MGVSELAPSYIQEQRITLRLSTATPKPRAFQLVVVEVDYSAALPEGVVLPLLFAVTGPTHSNRTESVLRRVAPLSLTFRPIEAGSHLIWLGELHHNRWWGGLVIDVIGDAQRESSNI